MIGEDLKKTTDNFRRIWNEANQHWNDEVFRRFESQYIAPILQASNQTVVALDKLIEILKQAETQIK